MQFQRDVRHGPRIITPRQLAAYDRSRKRKQDALPLLAPLIAETQLAPDDEMARRQAADLAAEVERRRRKAAGWREVRARLFALPDHARRAVLARYHASRWFPRTSGLLSSIIWDVLKGVDVPAAAVPPVPEADRIAAIAALNDRARRGDAWTRARRAYSPGALAFLAPGFTPDDENVRASLGLHTSRGRWSMMWDAVADFDDFGHNADPSGERRSGFFSLFGQSYRFEIFYLSHQCDGPSVAPHLADLSRRVVWIGLADEVADLTAATWTAGPVA